MRASRKAVMTLMVGAMLIAAVAGVSAQGFGRMSGPAATVPAYGYRQQVPAAPFTPAQPQAFRAYKNQARSWNRTAPAWNYMGRMGRVGVGAYGALHSYQYAQLSAENKAKVDKIMQESATEHLKLVTEMRAKKLELRNELWSASPDKAKIDSLTATINDLQKKILDLRNSKVLEINKIFQAAGK
ncbi:MAG: periplasmic heavy metal sensor [Spirochaetales bacterium]|nr:periplasmic heavy metal sensor [Spirochaetales bacterium]